MEQSKSVPELVAVVQANADEAQNRSAKILDAIGDESATENQTEDLRAATLAVEASAIELFSQFETQMQHHFRRGPFARKLKALLLDSNHTELAARLHQYYLAINVLKHGKGASYSELRALADNPFVLKKSQRQSTDETRPIPGLIDVNQDGFFDGLATTILDAHSFLENQETQE